MDEEVPVRLEVSAAQLRPPNYDGSDLLTEGVVLTQVEYAIREAMAESIHPYLVKKMTDEDYRKLARVAVAAMPDRAYRPGYCTHPCACSGYCQQWFPVRKGQADAMDPGGI